MKSHCLNCWNLHDRKICENCGFQIAEDIEQKLVRYENALKKIASQDYRGSRPYEQIIAEKALNGH